MSEVLEGYETDWQVNADHDYEVVGLDTGVGIILLQPGEAIALGAMLMRAGHSVLKMIEEGA